MTWADSTFTSGWHLPDKQGEYRKVVKPQEIATIGYVVSSDKDGICIAGTVNADKSILNPLVIPWGCVAAVEEMP